MEKDLLETERLLIRRPEIADLEKIFAYVLRNKQHFEKWDPKRTEGFYTREVQLEKLKGSVESNTYINFYLFRKNKPKKIIGEIGISNIVRGAFQNCHIGYKLDHQRTGKGLMREALQEVIRYIFQDLDLHRIEANILPVNTRSIKLIESLGFRKEGLSKALLKINGTWEDHYRYALLSSEANWE